MTRQQLLRPALMLGLMVLLSGCPDGEPPVTIEDATAPWHASTAPRVLEARVTLGAGWEIDAVYARFTRHYWPGAAEAHDVAAAETSPGSGLWRAAPTDATKFWNADRLYYQWFVDYKLPGGSDTLTVSTLGEGAEPHSFVVGCTPAQVDQSFDAIRKVMNGLQLSGGSIGENVRFALPAHFSSVCLANQGVPFARADASTTGVTLEDPDLLLYSPANLGGLTESELSDGIPDEPYELIGVGYGTFQNSTTRRPRLGCIPSNEWFLHEAGFHTPEGGMLLVEVDEEIPGETKIASDLPPSWAPVPPINSAWHPRIWDLHFWIAEGGDGRPVAAIDVPGGLPGLSLGEGVFFRPQTWE
ncbi:MAG: hypothetical protein AAGI70_15510 [Pseudomonadota bacterium]